MSLRINTNINSMNAQRNLESQQGRSAHAMKALSSGSRITQAADDAAGMAISQKLSSDVRSLGAARQNAENAISFIQVGEGGLNEVNNIIVRLRELGVQSASDTLGNKEREFVDMEAQQLLQEVDRIANTTKFGQTSLLNGSSRTLDFQVGLGGDRDSRISFTADADATTSNLGISGLSFDSKSGARSALSDLDDALAQVGGMRASFGAFQNRLDSTVRNLDVQNEGLSAANSRIKDADIAHESAELTSSQILQQAGIGVLAQANQSNVSALKLLG
jgi:flagellin